MNDVYWTDRGDRFTFSYRTTQIQWGIMDTLGNFTRIPLPSRLWCHGDSVPWLSELGSPVVRGTLLQFNHRAKVCFGTFDQDHPEKGVQKPAEAGCQYGRAWLPCGDDNVNGCYGTLSPNGEAYAHHEHTCMWVHNVIMNPDSSLTVANLISYKIDICTGVDNAWGLKWSNNFEWAIARRTDDQTFYILQLPQYPTGGTSNQRYYNQTVAFQPYNPGGTTVRNGGVMPDMWVGPFGRANMAGPPFISSQGTIVTDSVVITITPPDAQSVVYYTTDGSQPGDQSTRYSQPFGTRLTSDSLVVRARAYRTGVDPSSVVTCVVSRTKLRDADGVPVSPGLTYKYYTNSGLSFLPDFTGLTPATTGIVDSFTLSPATQTTNYAMLFEGYLSVPSSGIYRFATASDDGSKLWIGDSLIVSNDGTHGVQQSSGTIGLKAGLQSIKVGYFQGGGGYGLTVLYACTTLAEQLRPIGKSVCFHYDSLAGPPTVRIVAPIAGNVFHLGNTVRIRWTYGPSAAVRIAYSRNAGRNFDVSIDRATCDSDGSGVYDWVPVDTGMVSTQARILIADYSDGNIEARSEIFEIRKQDSAALRHGQDRGFPGSGVRIRGPSIICAVGEANGLAYLTLVSMDGRTFEPRALPEGGLVRWNIGNMTPGLYIARINAGKWSLSRRVLLQ